ncbi:MAG: DinB family protein, partial [Dehalococcoidia bacterium]|nr:DinB family protein [Dehalococcoidia bacterium]
DALDEFERASAHVPAPGRGSALGPLSTSGWVVGHVAAVQDRWLTFSGADGGPDEWCDTWIARQPTEVAYGQLVTPIEEALDTFRRVRKRAFRFLDGLDAARLRVPANLAGTPYADSGATVGYQVARSVAHAFVHAGDLTVIASLAGAGDLGLPGALSRTHEGAEEDDPSAPMVAALLRDAYVELGRAFHVLPLPSAQGEIVSLNAGSYIIVHALAREDRLWNVRAQGHEPDALLATYDGRAPAHPFTLDAVATSLDATTARASAWLADLDPAALATPIAAGRTESPIGVQVARSAAHLFSHAGELQSIASLSGGADLLLPGALAHTLEATR